SRTDQNWLNTTSDVKYELSSSIFFLLPITSLPSSPISTVWTQNIVSLILYEGHRDGTENITLIDRAPWLEYNIFHVDLPNRPSPRVICSHLPYYLIPKGLQNKRAKIIYVFRNPKDVLVSSYHFYKMLTIMETSKQSGTLQCPTKQLNQVTLKIIFMPNLFLFYQCPVVCG
uniref:Sulfotransferase n=1 Tax=Laticauda laticaudata TaxID=8630 RepID=A0A8C5RYP4_LATLA